jgi:hypothetical protein
MLHRAFAAVVLPIFGMRLRDMPHSADWLRLAGASVL